MVLIIILFLLLLTNVYLMTAKQTKVIKAYKVLVFLKAYKQSIILSSVKGVIWDFKFYVRVL